MKKKLVYVCSPLRGTNPAPLKYKLNKIRAAKHCHTIMKNFPDVIPIAPHVYFTQFLDDTNPTERLLGMEAGIELLSMCDELWVYGLHNPSEGMQAEIDYAKAHGITIRNGYIEENNGSERCVCCDESIPEGRQVCPMCEAKGDERQ